MKDFAPKICSIKENTLPLQRVLEKTLNLRHNKRVNNNRQKELRT